MSQLSPLRPVASASRGRPLLRLPLLLRLLLCLAIGIQCCSGGVVYQDWTSGSSFSLQSSGRTAVVAAQYSTAQLQSFSFSVYSSGDAADSFSHHSTSPHLTVRATGPHAASCSERPVSFSRASAPNSCNFTASWSVAFDGLLYLEYSSGGRVLNISTQLLSQKVTDFNLPAGVVPPVAFFPLSGDSFADSVSGQLATPLSIGDCSGSLGVATALPNRQLGTAWAASCFGAGIELPLAPPSPGSSFAVAAWVKMSNLASGLSWLGSATGELYHTVQDFVNSAGLVDESWVYTEDLQLSGADFTAPYCTDIQGAPFGCINNHLVRSVGNMSLWTQLMLDWNDSAQSLRLFVNGQLHFRGRSLTASSFGSSGPHGNYTLFMRDPNTSDTSLWGFGYGIRVWDRSVGRKTALYYYALDSSTGVFAPGPNVAAGRVAQHSPLFRNLARSTSKPIPSRAYSVVTTAADLTMTAVISPGPGSGRRVSTLDMGISWNMNQLSFGWLVPSYSHLVNTFNLFSPTILRLSSVDSTQYWNYSGPQGELNQGGVDGQPSDLTAADWTSLAGFMRQTNSLAHIGSALFLQSDHCTLDDYFNSTATAVAALGPSLFALQTDNEQDLVAPATLASAAIARVLAVQAAVPSVPNIRWSGPVSSDWNTFQMPQVWDLIHGYMQLFDFHSYDSITPPSSSYELISQGLVVAERQAAQVRDLVVAYGVPVVISECESVSSGGAFGYTDAYANAFWLINHAMALYAAGLSSLYLTGPGSFYSDFTPAGTANSGVLFLPHFYSRLLLSQMQALGGTVATATYNATLNVSVHATQVSKRSYCVVISNWDSAQTVNVTLSLPGLSKPQFTIAYITSLGLESNSGTSFAGGFVEYNGDFNPSVLYALPAGSRTVFMPVESIALVYVTAAAASLGSEPPFTPTREAVTLAAGASNFFPLEVNYTDVMTGDTGFSRQTVINASCLAYFVPSVLLPSGRTGSAYYQPCRTAFVSTLLRYNNSFTVSAWVQAASLSLTSVFGSTLGFSDVTTIVSASDSSGCCLLQHLPGLASIGNHPCVTNCTVGAWTHIAACWDAAAGSPSFWINGVAAAAQPAYNSSIFTSSPRGAVMFGNGDPIGGGSLVGLVGYVWHARYSPTIATTTTILSEIEMDLN